MALNAGRFDALVLLGVTIGLARTKILSTLYALAKRGTFKLSGRCRATEMETDGRA